MQLGHARRPWRYSLLAIFALFLFTRALTLMAFPIFNDEAIYIRYAQLIHENWSANKFVSMNNSWSDWKPPLQYWLAAPFVGWGRDPLFAARVVALVVSTFGLGGFYLFARELFDAPTGKITALLYVLCPTVLLHNNEFTAETFLFSTTPFVYWSLLRAMQAERSRWLWLLLALPLAIALLLLKQSGLLLLGLALFLPLARLQFDPPLRGESMSRTLGTNILMVAGVLVVAHLITRGILPPEFNPTKEQFNRRWVLSAGELLATPVDLWRANLRVVADFINSYYSVFVPVLFGVFVHHTWQRKSAPDAVLALMCLCGGAAIAFLLRGFNEYLFKMRSSFRCSRFSRGRCCFSAGPRTMAEANGSVAGSSASRHSPFSIGAMKSGSWPFLPGDLWREAPRGRDQITCKVGPPASAFAKSSRRSRRRNAPESFSWIRNGEIRRPLSKFTNRRVFQTCGPCRFPGSSPTRWKRKNLLAQRRFSRRFASRSSPLIHQTSVRHGRRIWSARPAASAAK